MKWYTGKLQEARLNTKSNKFINWRKKNSDNSNLQDKNDMISILDVVRHKILEASLDGTQSSD